MTSKSNPSESIASRQPATLQPLGMDDLVEDIFGLNWKGLKSIWTIIRRPWLYFEAAKSPKWQDRYTPSFRLWFAIMAIGTFFQFIWAGEKSPMFKLYEGAVTEIATQANVVLAEKDLMFDMTTFDAGGIAKLILKYSQLFLPVGYLIGLVIIAALFQSWGEKLSFVARLRYVFAIIIPGSLLGFAFATVTLGVSVEQLQFLNFFGMGIMFASYAAVAYLGPFRDQPRGVRIGRTAGITVLIIIGVMFGTMLSVGVTMFTVISTAFPDPVALLPAAP